MKLIILLSVFFIQEIKADYQIAYCKKLLDIEEIYISYIIWYKKYEFSISNGNFNDFYLEITSPIKKIKMDSNNPFSLAHPHCKLNFSKNFIQLQDDYKEEYLTISKNIFNCPLSGIYFCDNEDLMIDP